MEAFTVQSFEQMPAALQHVVNELQSIKQLLSTKTEATPEQSDDNKFLTRPEVAEMLRMSLKTLDTYTLNGKVKGHRIGTRVLYKPHEVQEALQKISKNIAA
jgi:hypothetical protein